MLRTSFTVMALSSLLFSATVPSFLQDFEAVSVPSVQASALKDSVSELADIEDAGGKIHDQEITDLANLTNLYFADLITIYEVAFESNKSNNLKSIFLQYFSIELENSLLNSQINSIILGYSMSGNFSDASRVLYNKQSDGKKDKK